MLRIIGAALVLLAGTGTGIIASATLTKRAESFEEIVRLILFLQTQIRYTAAPTGQIIETAFENEFSKLSFLGDVAKGIKKGGNPCDCWCKAVKKHASDHSLNAADSQLLQKFGQGLGNSDIKGQLSHCETFFRMFEDRLKSARYEAQSKGKLYKTLGIAGGIGTALLLY